MLPSWLSIEGKNYVPGLLGSVINNSCCFPISLKEFNGLEIYVTCDPASELLRALFYILGVGFALGMKFHRLSVIMASNCRLASMH